MHVEAGMLGQPSLDLRMLVGGIVVGDQMDRQVLRCFPVDFLEEGQPFLMPMYCLVMVVINLPSR